MEHVKIFFSLFLIASIINMTLVRPSFSETSQSNSEVIITEHQPESKIISEAKIQSSWLSRNKWWVFGGLVIIIGGVAAAAAGSSGGKNNTPQSTGSYSGTW